MAVAGAARSSAEESTNFRWRDASTPESRLGFWYKVESGLDARHAGRYMKLDPVYRRYHLKLTFGMLYNRAKLCSAAVAR